MDRHLTGMGPLSLCILTPAQSQRAAFSLLLPVPPFSLVLGTQASHHHVSVNSMFSLGSLGTSPAKTYTPTSHLYVPSFLGINKILRGWGRSLVVEHRLRMGNTLDLIPSTIKSQPTTNRIKGKKKKSHAELIKFNFM